MDRPLGSIVRYATGLRFEDLSEHEVGVTVRHIIDALGCAFGAAGAEPAEIARRLAAGSTSPLMASVIGADEPSTVELAAFANAIMVRYLDYNDAGASGHASDMIPGILAVAEAIGASGKDLVVAVFAAYEVAAALYRDGDGFFDLYHAGLDQIWAGAGVAVGAGLLLGLTPGQLANAVSMTVVPAVPLRVTRTGVLSHWKGTATPYAGMNAVFATRAAKEGLTAPGKPFEGTDGFERISGFKIGALEDIGKPIGGRSAIERTAYKYYPAEYNAQGPLAVLIDNIVPRLPDPDQIERVVISMFEVGHLEIGGAQGDRESKWNPTTRETADHSMPYLVGVAILDGDVTIDSFTDERINDPRLRAFMQKIEVTHDEELTRALEKGAGMIREWPTIIEITLADGTVIRERSSYPKGSAHNDLTDEEIVAKFHSMAKRVLSPASEERLLELLWKLPELENISDLGALLREVRTS